MRIFLFQAVIGLCLCSVMVSAGPQFCTRGFQLASRFYKCWEQAIFSHKYPALHEPHDQIDAKFFAQYATHMCSVVKPAALKCLDKEVKECDNRKKLMAIADKSGGACEENHLNPFFNEHVVKHLVAVKSDSPCFDLADNSYECYTEAGQKVTRMGGKADNIVNFHKTADHFFNAYWDCMVVIYKSNIKVCPHWQIPMLLTLQKTAMPSLFGLRLKPEQVQKLELSNMTTSQNVALDRGPSTLYLLMQLHKTKPEISEDDEESVVLQLTDLNNKYPKLQLEEGQGEDTSAPSLSLKEIKNLMREYRRRKQELKDFINQAKGKFARKKAVKKQTSSKKKPVYKKKNKTAAAAKKEEKLLDGMIA